VPAPKRNLAAGTTAVLAALVVAIALPAAGAGAKRKHKVTVRPGKTAITKALNRVKQPGVLRIKSGRYREAVTIDKQVKLKGVGKGRRPIIDGRCRTDITVAVRHDDVRLRSLRVVGAGTGTFPIEVDFREVSGGVVKEVLMKDTCDADYGLNLYETGPIGVFDSKAVGFSDAGFYVGEITSTPGGAIYVWGNEGYHNNRGVIVENSAGGEIQIRDNRFNFNDVPGFSGPVGILINNSDGVAIEGNDARGNAAFGLHLTIGSDGNVALSNSLLGNPIDIRDQGSGNCGAGNTFTTGDPLPPC
jgi:parallel beta-helix repeat protein